MEMLMVIIVLIEIVSSEYPLQLDLVVVVSLWYLV